MEVAPREALSGWICTISQTAPTPRAALKWKTIHFLGGRTYQQSKLIQLLKLFLLPLLHQKSRIQDPDIQTSCKDIIENVLIIDQKVHLLIMADNAEALWQSNGLRRCNLAKLSIYHSVNPPPANLLYLFLLFSSSFIFFRFIYLFSSPKYLFLILTDYENITKGIPKLCLNSGCLSHKIQIQF